MLRTHDNYSPDSSPSFVQGSRYTMFVMPPLLLPTRRCQAANEQIFHSCILHYSNFTSYFFFFNDTATTEIYTLSLHDALPISKSEPSTAFTLLSAFKLNAAVTPSASSYAASRIALSLIRSTPTARRPADRCGSDQDRKSTRLNSSHQIISYAVFCLKQKKKRFE